MSRYIGTLYQIKRKLPLKARIMSFNSLVLSHLNYCSIIWGTTNKTKIEQLFTVQKKAIRAIMPGNINYYYKDGINPTHTKAFCNEHNILTAQNIIVKNILVFLNKVHNFAHLLPRSVLNTIADESPSPLNIVNHSSRWYQKYNTTVYRMSVFFKGPILYAHICKSNAVIDCNNKYKYKTNVKFHLLKDIQCLGTLNEWTPTNFPLYNIMGLRSSDRIKQAVPINYNET